MQLSVEIKNKLDEIYSIKMEDKFFVKNELILIIKKYYEWKDYNYIQNIEFESRVQNICNKFSLSHRSVKIEALWEEYLKKTKSSYSRDNFKSRIEAIDYLREIIKSECSERPKSNSDKYYDYLKFCSRNNISLPSILESIYWKYERKNKYWVSQNKTKEENTELIRKYAKENGIKNSSYKWYSDIVRQCQKLWIDLNDVISFENSKWEFSKRKYIFKEKVKKENKENVFNEISSYLKNKIKEWNNLFGENWILEWNLYSVIYTRIKWIWLNMKDLYNEIWVSPKTKIEKNKDFKIKDEYISDNSLIENKTIQSEDNEIKALLIKKEIALIELETQKIKNENLKLLIANNLK